MTAVEWLILEMNKTGFIFDKIDLMVFEQAKEMEKQQIIEAVSKGWNNRENGKVRWIGEQYYNETFKK